MFPALYRFLLTIRGDRKHPLLTTGFIFSMFNRIQDFGISEPNDTDSSEPEFSDTDFSLEEEEEKAPQNSEEKIESIFPEKLIRRLSTTETIFGIWFMPSC